MTDGQQNGLSLLALHSPSKQAAQSRSSSVSRRSSSSSHHRRPAPHGCPLELLSIRDHNGYRGSASSSLAALNSPSTPPLTPWHQDSIQLYPLPPHLTPQHSPERPSSPVLAPEPSSDEEEMTNGHNALHMAVDESTSTISSTHLMGRLTVKVIEAVGLEAPTGNEKPYLLVQYDRTDSVSRVYDAPPVQRKPPGPRKLGLKKPRPNLRQTQSSAAVVTVRRVGRPRPQDEDPTSPTSAHSPMTIDASNFETNGLRGDPAVVGTADAPRWNHVAQFDVVQPDRTLLICVYDRAAPQAGDPRTYHGFLGCAVIEPPVTHDPGPDGEGLDVWLPLESALNPDIRAEIHIRLLFEALPARPKLTVSDFEVLKQIGQGSFGKVFRVRKRDTKRIYAMKVISKANIVSKEALSQVLAERHVLAKTLDSPFLVGLKFSFQTEADLFFVMDYKSGGELFDLLQREGGRFGEDKVKFYLAEIVLALKYLHEHGIIYRDLKPENCLLDGSGHVVLVDFGLSKMLQSAQEITRTLCGTTAFMAPEVLLDTGYNYLADLWSLGVLAFEMICGWSPFYSESRMEEYERILELPIKIPARKGYSEESRDFIMRLLTRDPKERLGARGGSAEVQSHAFFAAIDWDKCARRALSPPYKPPIYADDDICEERARSAAWMFGDGGNPDAPSGTQSLRDSPASSSLWANSSATTKNKADLDTESLFRDFTFHWKEARHDGSQDRRSSWSPHQPATDDTRN